MTGDIVMHVKERKSTRPITQRQSKQATNNSLVQADKHTFTAIDFAIRLSRWIQIRIVFKRAHRL